MTGPETDRERIETALAEGRVSATDPRERELQELALALRADSAEPRPAFAADLDRRGGGGLPAPPPSRAPRSPRTSTGGWRPAFRSRAGASRCRASGCPRSRPRRC